MTGNAGTAPRRKTDSAALSRNGKMGALIREATMTDPERVQLGRMGHKGLRNKWERELDPDGKLRARNPTRLEKLLDKRERVHSQAMHDAKRRKHAVAPVVVDEREPIRVALYDCKLCAKEQGRETVPEAVVRPCLAHLLKLAPPENPIWETARWLHRFCDVLLIEQMRTDRELSRLERELATAS